jgi:hypothetical protein
MKVFVVYEPEGCDMRDIICVTTKEEEAVRIVSESNHDLNYTEYELDNTPTGVYEINIKMDGNIVYCKKNFSHIEDVTVNKFSKDILVYTKADNKSQAIEIAKQKLEERIIRKQVEVIEWKDERD